MAKNNRMKHMNLTIKVVAQPQRIISSGFKTQNYVTGTKMQAFGMENPLDSPNRQLHSQPPGVPHCQANPYTDASNRSK